jgi:hypothetical protein
MQGRVEIAASDVVLAAEDSRAFIRKFTHGDAVEDQSSLFEEW